MNQQILKKALPHVIAVVVFLIAGVAYFSPVMEGYHLSQSDIMMHKGTSKEIQDFREAYGEEPLWTNNVFGGMPATQISMHYPTNLMQYVSKAFQLWLPAPLNFFFLLMIGFYIMTLLLNIKPWIGIAGSILYALSCYFVIIIMVGHNTKVLALGYLPAMIGAVIYTYRSQKLFLGAALTCLFVALELTSNHVQITYYGMFILFFFVVFEFISFYKKKETKNFLVRSGFVSAAFLIGALCAIGNLWGTMEYGKYTTRGGSEITISPDGKENAEDKTNGLDRSYITGWSYGVNETWNLLIPNAKGGASGALLNNPDIMDNPDFTQEDKLFLQLAYQRDRFIFSDYWGEQSTTAGPTYIGAIVIFLCIIAFVFVEDNLKWALLGATVLTTMLAWGKNFAGLTDFFIDYFPMYSKFRTVSMMLVVAELTIPLLAVLLLKKITEQKSFSQEKIKQFMIASGSLLGIILIMALTKGGSVVSTSEKESDYFVNYKQTSEKFTHRIDSIVQVNNISIDQIGPENKNLYDISKMMIQSDEASIFEEKLVGHRRGIFTSDAWRSFMLIAGATLLLFFFFKEKINSTVMLIGVSLLAIGDLWMVDKRWVNNDIAKDRDGKEMKDKDGDPVYEQWSKAVATDKPHTASFTDYAILMTEYRANESMGKMIDEKINAYKEEKKSSGATNYTITREEQDYIAFGVLNLNTNYRVLNTTKALDQDGRSCYFHKSLGGYHGAKLERIQDVIDFELGKEQQLVKGVLNAGSVEGIDSALKKFPVVNMLNTKYVIFDDNGGEDVDGDGSPDGKLFDPSKPERMMTAPIGLINPRACGNAWFVSNIKWVKDANEEILAIGNFDPSTTAIIDEREKEKLNGLTPASDPNASVKMDSYKANHISYTSESSKKNLMVFSEIYYPIGWKALIDGTPAEIIRVNYLLRAIVVEPGKHTIEMVYEPSSYYTSKPIALFASLSVIGILLFAFYREYKPKKSA